MASGPTRWQSESAASASSGGVAAQFSLGMVLWMLWGARRLGTAAGGRWGVLLLVLSEAFNTTGGEARLDAPLLFFSTGAAMAALVLPPRFSGGVLVAVLAGAGVLVKGPFGLLPLVAAGVTRALLEPSRERSWRVLPWVAGVALVAVLPLTAFLYWDATHLGGTWWRGYGQAQLLASALGRRTDGLQPWWYPFSTLGTRFWPGLPFLGLGGVLLVRRGLSAEHRPALRRLGLTTLLCLLGLGLPARKLWHHALVVFPMAALFGGVAIQAAWARWRRADSWSPVLVSALALAVWTGVVTGAGRVLYRPRCLSAGPFAPALSRLTVGEEILVVSPRPEWAVLSALSAERRLVPVSTRVLPPPLGARASVALIHGVPPAAGSGWRVIEQRGDWTLAHACTLQCHLEVTHGH